MEEKSNYPIWHPYTQMQTADFPIEITSAKGAKLYADDGRVFIDAISSWWTNIHGHAHPYIAQKIAEQRCKKKALETPTNIGLTIYEYSTDDEGL